MQGIGPNDRTGGASTSTLLQNVKILAVDKNLDTPTVDPKGNNAPALQSVTLLVTPDQAAKLDLGQNRGTLHLSLRSPNDNDAAVTRPATLKDMEFYQERPWGEQAKDVINALGKLWEGRKKEEKEEEPARLAKVNRKRPPATPPQPMEIRTLRGRTNGLVLVEPIPAPEEDR